MDQLAEKDNEYMKALKKQNDDIDDLIKSMAKQYIDMRNDYGDQLNVIENNFNTERQKILNRNAEEI
jgi:acid phosphatase class B